MILLPYIRLSVLEDNSTSPERQMSKIETYARLGDHELIRITEAGYDLDVSGSVSPFDRPGLSPWLREDLLNMWDAICVAKLDRLTRSLLDFVTFTSWLEAQDKTLVCLDPILDLSTPAGRAFASVTATFAQFERDTIAARVCDAWHKLRENGKYGGGQVPFGYRPVRLDKGWGYEPDPVYGPVVAEMCDRYLSYESLSSITRWLNETGVPTPWNATRKRNGKPVKDTTWKTPSVRKILGSPAMLGATVKTDGTPVRDEQGVVLYRADELVTWDVYERVQARLAANRVSVKVNAWALTQIVFCAGCGAAMYGSTAKYDGKTYMYYCCVHSMRRDGLCTARRVKADELEMAISRELQVLVGDFELIESKVIPGRDYSEDIARVAEQIGHLFSEIQVEALSGTDIREKQATLQRAQDELTRLHALKPMQARAEPAKSGKTFRQRWAELDTGGRNELLRRANVRVIASRNEPTALDMPMGSSPPGGIPRSTVISDKDFYAVLQLGGLVDLLDRASAACHGRQSGNVQGG
jgi:DNA invertase Pin-like site-specific DNA recombinase